MATAPNPQLLEFMQKLARATADGKLAWRSVEGSASTFEVEAGSGTVRIFSADRDDTHPFRFVVLNPQDEIVSAAETELAPTYNTWELLVEDIYVAAKDKALGVTDVLNSLERELELDKGDDIPF